MKNKKTFIFSHLSLLSILPVYLILVGEHLLVDGFILSNQLSILSIILPLALLAWLYDILLNKSTVKTSYRVIGKLCLVFICLVRFLVNFILSLGKEPADFMNYIHYLLLTLPFLIASYQKEEHKRKLTYTLIGLAAIGSTYMYLANQTEQLSVSSGAIIYLFSYAFMIYSSSSLKKLPFLGTVTVCANALVLLYLRFLHASTRVLVYGWDNNFSFYFELIMLVTFVILAVESLIAMLSKKNGATTS